MKPNNKPTSLRLEEELQKELDLASKRLARPKSWIIKEAIRHYLDERADLEIALDRLKDPNSQYVDWDQVSDDV